MDEVDQQQIWKLEEENRKLMNDCDNLESDKIELTTERDALRAENDRLVQWVSDLQSGMYINCVYCGHQYGPKESTPINMSEVLRQHIEKCPKHPLSLVTKQRDALRNERDALRDTLKFISDTTATVLLTAKHDPMVYAKQLEKIVGKAETAIREDKK